MPNYDKHIIVGHVGADPELRYTNEGVAVVNISVAVNNPRRKDDPPTWYRCAIWRQTAEFVNEYVRKGTAVLVEGDGLKLSEWAGQDGTQRVSLEMTAQRVELVGARDDAREPARDADSDRMPF